MRGMSMLRLAPDSIPGAGSNHTPSGIRHTPQSTLGAAPAGEAKPQIRTFEQTFGAGMSESQWKRKPAATGTGAVHVRSFHCKLTGDCLENLDRQINEWLDAHPDYEVKMVTSTVGDWTGKLKEPNLIIQVWV